MNRKDFDDTIKKARKENGLNKYIVVRTETIDGWVYGYNKDGMICYKMSLNTYNDLKDKGLSLDRT